MSFKDLSLPELKQAAEDFGVEYKPNSPKPIIVKAFERDGITWDLYLDYKNQLEAPEDDELSPAQAELGPVTSEAVTNPVDVFEQLANEQVAAAAPAALTVDPNLTQRGQEYLVKMNRENPYFEWVGSKKYKFSKTHPFAVMDADDVDGIMRDEVGFSIATPSEARAFYGG